MSGLQGLWKRASGEAPFSRSGALLALWLLSWAAWAGGCPPPAAIEQWGRVAWVYDGDTVRLADGRKVRLIGVNAPELHPEPEAGARAAHQALMRWLRGQRVGLVFGPERADHYGRTLARIFLEDGVDVQWRLLRQGLAAWVVVPPNDAGLDCYRRAERLARSERLGIWRSKALGPFSPARLYRRGGGFAIVEGRVERIERRRGRVRLVLAPRVAIEIDPRRLAPLGPLPDPESLLGRTLSARGWWVERGRQLILPLRHPALLETSMMNPPAR